MLERTPGDDSHALAGVVAMIAPAEIAMTVAAADRNRLRTGLVLHIVDGEIVFPLPPPGGGCVWMKQIRQRLLPGQQADYRYEAHRGFRLADWLTHPMSTGGHRLH